MMYGIDANVFIEAAKRYYAFDLVPGFWDSLTNLVAQGRVSSIDRVNREIKEDDVREWIDKKGGFAGGFASTDDPTVIDIYRQIMTWVNAQAQFLPAAKSEFARGADGWLIAYAKVHGLTVVTHEVLAPAVKRKVPIPNVCLVLEVPYRDTFQMLRVLGISFR
jgi:hypothetical protein